MLNRNIRTFTSYQLVNYHLPQISANYLVLDMTGDQCNSLDVNFLRGKNDVRTAIEHDSHEN